MQGRKARKKEVVQDSLRGCYERLSTLGIDCNQSNRSSNTKSTLEKVEELHQEA